VTRTDADSPRDVHPRPVDSDVDGGCEGEGRALGPEVGDEAEVKPTVVFDTNALMMPVECDVRVFEELDRLGFGDAAFLAPAAVIEELDRLAAGGGREAVAASVGRDLAGRVAVAATRASYADDAVVELATGGVDGRDRDRDRDAEAVARERDASGERVVVTNDRPLRDRLLARGVRVIALRGRNKLDVTQP
jgi:rRNA-processing protein FCF1